MSLADCKSLLIKNNICLWLIGVERQVRADWVKWLLCRKVCLRRKLQEISLQQLFDKVGRWVFHSKTLKISRDTRQLYLTRSDPFTNSNNFYQLYLPNLLKLLFRWRKIDRWYQSNEALFQYWLIKYIKLFSILFLTKTNERNDMGEYKQMKWKMFVIRMCWFDKQSEINKPPKKPK